MKKIILETKRHWNWKVFFVLVGLIIPALFAILPYTLHLQNISLGWDLLVLDRLIYILLYSLLGGIGLARSGSGSARSAWKRGPSANPFHIVFAT